MILRIAITLYIKASLLCHLTSFGKNMDSNITFFTIILFIFSKNESPWVGNLFQQDRNDLVVKVCVQPLHLELVHLRQKLNDYADGSIWVLKLNSRHFAFF